MVILFGWFLFLLFIVKYITEKFIEHKCDHLTNEHLGQDREHCPQSRNPLFILYVISTSFCPEVTTILIFMVIISVLFFIVFTPLIMTFIWEYELSYILQTLYTNIYKSMYVIHTYLYSYRKNSLIYYDLRRNGII